MDDGGVNGPRDIGAVETCSGIHGSSGEPDLVVQNDMDGALSAIAFEVPHLQSLIDDSLACERGVTVDLDGDGGFVSFLWVEVLEGSGFALDD